MRHINDNMDELFQKAAEGYPLRTDSFDWEAVNKKLAFEEDAVIQIQRRSFRKPLHLCMAVTLFLAIPLSVSNYLMQYSIASKGNASLKNLEQAASANLAKAAVGLHTANSFNKTTNLFVNTGQELFIDKNASDKKSDADFSLNEIDEVAPRENTLLYSNSNSLVPVSLLHKENIQVVTDAIKQLNEKSVAQTNVQNSLESNKKELIKLNAQKKNIYAGFIGAGELTNVHGQAFRKPGFNGGFVLGFNLSNKLQAEIGVIASRKYYYSDGKYASPNSIRDDGLPIGGVKIYSSMAEIPLLLRYNITNTNANKLFVATGGVANIIHKEHYNYGYIKDGRDKKGGKIYNDSVDNLFSNIQISMGYEHKIGNAGYMRVEPYYRVPINGTGAANFHVASMGINIGLIKYFK